MGPLSKAPALGFIFLSVAEPDVALACGFGANINDHMELTSHVDATTGVVATVASQCICSLSTYRQRVQAKGEGEVRRWRGREGELGARAERRQSVEIALLASSLARRGVLPRSPTCAEWRLVLALLRTHIAQRR